MKQTTYTAADSLQETSNTSQVNWLVIKAIGTSSMIVTSDITQHVQHPSVSTTYYHLLPEWLSLYSDSLRAERSEDRIPVRARFSAPIQTGSEAHPASCTMGTESFPGVKRPGRGADHLPPSSVPRFKEESRAIPLLSLRGPSGL